VRHDVGVVVIRSAVPGDDLDALNEGNADWVGQDTIRALYAALDDARWGMLVAELDGDGVGYADWVALGLAGGHRGPATVYVRAEHRGHGVGSALWGAVLAAFPRDVVPGLRLCLDADDGRSRGIAESRGLDVGGLHLQSELDLGTLDVEAFQRLAVPPAGVSVHTLGDARNDGEWAEFVEVYNRMLADTPDNADGADREPPELLRALLPQPWQVMAAFAGDRIVGFTSLSVFNEGERKLFTPMTGVEREFRGRRVGTALKAAHALVARELGWRATVTHNMQGNAAMLASNQTLGFRRTRAFQDLTYDFGPEHPAAD
jgi:GNAT superfamily N-acetyltransferase